MDIYARSDITALAPANAYNRLQWEDVTVGQALRLGAVRFFIAFSLLYSPRTQTVRCNGANSAAAS